MALFVILNIIIVVGVLLIDMHRHQYQYIRLSTVLFAITLNGLINPILLNQISFITMATFLMYLIWYVLQIELERTVRRFNIKNQKFFTMIIAIMISILFVVMAQTADQSYYMSVPYLAPAIFLFGAILQFSCTLQSTRFNAFYRKLKIKQPLWIGACLIVLSMVLMMLLTPFWYLFLIVHLNFFTLFVVEKLFILRKDV
ncbi:hypothetical protein [Staphylococcus lutrae]|uniref:Uncharacterized protein n=1 Tax=Staphylococcus lutrae TaxID=155085 RepID=A0AAC9WMN4_9STAP|nr:hypothetical protein [Staphylococcus lutrae]ARJ51242.1 hypothetical protein B5P37_07935 [Staphylococcus lutrae]PNZ39487.1 hypothetical protein CD134_01265 [Staphylococcus lutrae]